MGIVIKSKASQTAASPAASTTSAPASNGGKPSWFKRGDAVAKQIEQEDAKVAKRVEDNQKMWRFYIKEGEVRTITFVDGHLTPAGILDVFSYREHQVNIGGDWRNWFVCTSEQEPCPICETVDANGKEAYLAGALTIIDHTEVPVKGKDGKPDRIINDNPRLYVAKRQTIKILQQLAVKRNGLAGCTFDVTRQGENSPNVGNMFDFTTKHDLKELQAHFVREVIDPKTKEKKVASIFVPADYEREIGYKSAAELRALGFGGGTPIGAEKSVSDAKPAGASVSQHL